MKNIRSYWCCGLVVGAALFATGPAQMASRQNVVVAHAPMIRAYGPGHVPVPGPHNETTSNNWSGYALSTGSTGNYTSATASWTVPTVTFVGYPSGPSFEDSSSWVGIGGFSTGDLIQLGTEQFVQSTGSTTYDAWYEILPASETVLPAGHPVSPGDAMTASLVCTSNCTVNNPNTTWTLQMADATKGWTFSINLTYASCLCSVEWIQEAPFFSKVVAIPSFGVVPFTSLTVSGSNPNLSLSADGIILQDAAGGFSTPCTAPGGNNFLAAYGVNCPSLVLGHNFNDDDTSDILWRNTSGSIAAWLMNGNQVLASQGLGAVTSAYSIIGQHDFNGDGKADVLWRDTSGNISIWFMNGAAVGSEAAVGNLASNWTLYGVGDLNGDGKGDLLWRDSGTGTVAVWFMNGASVASTTSFGPVASNWTLLGDGNGGILWRDSAGDIALWVVQNGQVTGSHGLGNVSSNFFVQAVGDFNGDGFPDILWRDTNSGALSIWFTNGSAVTSGAPVGTLPSNWNVVQVGDYNGDGLSDILLLDSAGDLAVWLMNGATVSSALGIGNVGTTWQVQNMNTD